jgi:menaquinol-cytochrome c reductase iron-sulfur subunit
MSNCCKEPRVLPDWKKVFVSRDEFLKLLSIVLSGFIGLVSVLPGVAFAFSYFLDAPKRKWIDVGPLEKFLEGETVDVVFQDPVKLAWDGVTGRRSAWLRREKGEDFKAYAVNCTHLGCPVKWESGAELFMCPCHGGVYYSNGEVAGGPPPRPLHEYPVRVVDGHVEIEVRPVLAEG